MGSLGKLSGQVALITGGGGGFGESFARRFVAEGAKVVIAELNPTAGKRVEQDIALKNEDSILFVEADVTNRSSWEAVLKATLQTFGKLDILVNNAGTTHAKKPSHDITDSEWSRLVDVNMKSIYLSFAVIIPYFRDQKKGVVLNISSIGGLRAKDELVFYGASKAFVNKVGENPIQ
jgi:3-oxoacyl-[acyl-carrier protein] reductase